MNYHLVKMLITLFVMGILGFIFLFVFNNSDGKESRVIPTSNDRLPARVNTR